MTLTISEYRREQQLSSVRLVSNSNVSGTYSNGAGNNGVGATLTTSASTLTVDSVAAVNGNRVLLLNQTNAYENGIYEVSGVGGTVVLTRSDDFQTSDQMRPGYYVPVEAGTVFAGGCFTVVEPQVAIVGTDDITFTDNSSNPTSVNLANNGLNIFNPAGTFLNHVLFDSAITADRNFTITTGDAARTLTFTGDATLNQDVDTTASPTFVAVTVGTSGLLMDNPAGTFTNTILLDSAISADRVFTLTTGDAARTLDISAADVTISSYGATIVDDATALAALTTLGIKRATTAAYGGGGTSNAFTATGLLSTDIVVASILAQTNAASIVKVVPTADTLTVTFSADPGAATTVSWIALPTV